MYKPSIMLQRFHSQLTLPNKSVKSLQKQRPSNYVLNKQQFHSVPINYSRATKRPIRQEQLGGCKKSEFMNPSGKVAIITGGATGIGLAAAQELLQNGLHKVVLAGNVSSQGTDAECHLNREFGRNKAVFIQADVTDNLQFEDVFKETIESFKQVDIVFNNAGIMEDKNWERELKTNVGAVIQGTLLAFKYMSKEATSKEANSCNSEERGGGIVINNADVLGLRSLPSVPIYCTTKQAVIGAVKNFGDPFHYQRTGVRVVGLCPGVTETSLVDTIDENQLTPEFGKVALETLASAPCQRPDMTGRALLYIIRYAPSASVWVVENSVLSLANVEHRKDDTTVVMSLK